MSACSGNADRQARGCRPQACLHRPFTFAMESVVELSSSLADEARNDIRIEAALASSTARRWHGWWPDETSRSVAVAGLRTAESLRTRCERAIPAEQILRDLRIGRIFEGSTEIMKLLIAREGGRIEHLKGPAS